MNPFRKLKSSFAYLSRTADLRERALHIATDFIKKKEDCFLFAYPDPASAMGRALKHAGIVQVGRTGVIPQAVAHLAGGPWTIGWGQTGTRVQQGTRWTQKQADTVLQITIETYYRQIEEVWPGAHRLRAGAQAALISIVYNRGTSLVRRSDDILDRRYEMRELVGAVSRQDYTRIKDLIWAMRRIWLDSGLGGLVKRREQESQLVLIE